MIRPARRVLCFPPSWNGADKFKTVGSHIIERMQFIVIDIDVVALD
jgi:hypothetical protein